MEENKEVTSKENISNVSSKSSKPMNPWMIASAILGIAVIALFLIVIFKGGLTGNVISGDSAGTQLVTFLNKQTNGGVTYLASVDKGNLYEVTVSYKNQTIPVYITKDGKYFVQGAVPLDSTTDTNSSSSGQQASQPVNVTKSDKPVVEAFVFSYCPYGLQFEKALFPVYDLLKNKADIKIVYIGAMHGEFEHVESLRQIAILKLYGNDKLISYLKEFDVNSNIGSCSGDATCLNKYLPAIYTKLGMNQADIEAYMNKSSEQIYQNNEALANQMGIGGSPTFVINGAQVNVNRTPAAIGKAVCDAFTTTPSECSQTLSSSATSPGFGSDTGGTASASSAAGCAAA